MIAGRGPDRTRILIVKDYPDYSEDAAGQLWNSREGELLRDLLTKSRIRPDYIYSTCLVKCKPDKKPTKSQVDICKHWLWREMKALEGELAAVITLGKLPLRVLSGSDKHPVGEWVECNYLNMAKIMPAHDLSYVMRRGKAEIENMIEILIKVREYAKWSGIKYDIDKTS